MKSVGELVVLVANLAEAEGRAAKRNAVRVSAATVILLSAASLLVTGFLALCAAAFLGLNTVMHPGWALGIVSVAPIVLGAFALTAATMLIREGKKG